jgi:transcriptional regulator with XRE-family HTH domain
MDIMLNRILQVLGKKHGDTKKLAEYLGVSANSISDWKAGRVKSYIKYAPQIAEYYNVSLDWLSGNSDTIEKPVVPEGYELSDLDKKLFDVLPTMTVQEKLMILAQIEAYKNMKE